MKKYTKIIMLILILAIGFITYKLLAKTEIEKMIKKKGSFNFLILGLDSVEHISRADTIIIGHIDKKGHVHLLSIPRDTRINYLGDFKKINTVFSRGYVKSGIKLYRRLKQVIKGNFNIDVTRYIILDYNTFAKIIDMIGGVDIYVSKDMYYLDKNGKLLIDIKKNVNHLDGKSALEFVRYRSDGRGDIGRIERQKDFINSLLSKASLNDFINNSKVVSLILANLKSNFTFKEVYFLKKLIGTIDMNKMKMRTLPGRSEIINRGSYWIPDRSKDFNSLFKEKKKGTKLLVEILNGNGVPGLGEKIAKKVRRLGYDVISIRNADKMDYEKSVLINYTNNYADVEKIADALNIKLTYLKENKGVYDVKIILGKDITDMD
jgi:LCP family protein required for cell wall assembly